MSSKQEIAQAFDSIESAKDFIMVLLDTIEDSSGDLLRDRERAIQDGDERRVQALDLTLYKLKMLGTHIGKSRRILNDLRILRRLLMDERSLNAVLEQKSAAQIESGR